MFLKLFKISLNNIGQHAFQGLLRVIIKKPDDLTKGKKKKLFEEDSKMIGLILHKFTSKQISLSNKVVFLLELRSLLREASNMRAFLIAPHSLNFINELINLDYSALRLEEGYNKAIEQDMGVSIHKILRRFITHTLSSKDCIFYLISLFEYTNYSKQDGTVKENISTTQGPAKNFFKMMTEIEYVLNTFKRDLVNAPNKTNSSKNEGRQGKEESKSEGRSTNESALSELRSSLMENIPILVSYFEYVLSKVKNFEQDETNIIQFTLNLFDFVHRLKLLFIIYPLIKRAPFDLNSNSLLKRYENVCYRNGGVLMSMIAILFTVLRRAKSKENKLIILQNYSHILFLNKPELFASQPRKASLSVKQLSDVVNLQTTDQNLNSHIKAVNSQPTKNTAVISLIDYGTFDKSEEIITSRVKFLNLSDFSNTFSKPE